MTIEPINGIPEIPKADKLKSKKVEKKTGLGQDNVSISSEARFLQKLEEDIKIAKEAIKNQPELRMEKVQQARERLESGFYNDKKVLETIAERLYGLLNE